MPDTNRLKVHCPCGSHVWATSLQPERDSDGEFWPVERHDRPDGRPCPHLTVRQDFKVLSLDDLSPEFRARVEARARVLAEQRPEP